MTLQEFFTAIKVGTIAVQGTLTRPDEDWDPIAFVHTPRDGTSFFKLDPRFFATQENKNILTHHLLPQLVLEKGARFYGFITAAWMVEYQLETISASRFAPKHEIPPSQHPNRIEAVVIHAMDASHIIMGTARVTRYPAAPPTLATDWKVTEEDIEDSKESRGRFVDPMLAALRKANPPPSVMSEETFPPDATR